ncbi:helix-turn-helix domain-containing protein [Vibrio fluvialis]|uniref:helix-turn-helix domain-containing protein n=1 Tax=Vibrio furnissii TaxID=29494 RepID=UPI0015594AAB|nr:helix-turn-helix domain-containing protein [Vibrio furnissii]EKO3488615.1 helix-turn-helix domain-containing protein [Vibrio fluvialis]
MAIPNEYWDLVDNIGGMKGSEKSVLNFLCRKANPKKNYSSWRSVSEMARILCVSERSVKNATKALSDMGLITKQLRKDSSSIYALNLERISQLGRGNLCPHKEDDVTVNTTEEPQHEICKGSICPPYRQYLPDGGAVFAYKNANENVIENVNTGGTGVRKKVTHENLSDEIIAFWKAIRTHVRDLYQVERFPSRPSQEDIDAMEWAIDEMLPNGVSDNDCRLLCIYVDDELGEPHSVLNPIVRLRLAYGAHEWPEMRFGEKFWQYMEDYNRD